MYNLVKKYLDQIILLISENTEISKLISGAFYNIPTNQLYPFIHLCNISLKNYGVKNSSALEVIFDLTIYAKANDFIRLNQISDLVTKQLTTKTTLLIQGSKINLSSKTNIYENKMNIKLIIHEE